MDSSEGSPQAFPKLTFLNPKFYLMSWQLGMLIPTGTPELANASTSKLVKSGFLNSQTQNYFPQVKYCKVVGALSTNLFSSSDSYLLTTETKPQNSALIFNGSRQLSINPMLVSMIGPISFIQCFCDYLCFYISPVLKWSTYSFIMSR